MKHKLLIFLCMLMGLPAMANLNGNGYYRVQNYGTQRWISVVDNKGSIDFVATTGDFHAIALTSGLSNVVYDAGSVLYIENISGSQYNVKAQNTSVYQIIGHNMSLRENGSANGQKLYMAYGTYSGVTRYLADTEAFGDEGVMGIATSPSRDNAKWMVYPISTSDDNYFGIQPTVEAGGKRYATLYSSFPYGKSSSASGMKFYYIKRIDHGQAEMVEISGNIPAATPVIIECPGSTPATNRIDVGVSASAISGNSLIGVYYSLNYGGFKNYITYDPQTMRVLGKCSDGSLGFVTSNISKIPANSAYITVPAGSPAEFKCVSTQEFDSYVPPINELYVIGNFNNWATPNASSSYVILTKTGDKVFSGKISYSQEGTLEFKVYDAKSSDAARHAYGSSSSSAVSLEENVASSWNMTLGGSNNFKIDNWGGSTGTITVDLNTMKLTVTTDKVEVKELYLVGNFNNWATPNGGNGYFTLAKTGTKTFSGTINYNQEGTLEFKVYDAKSADAAKHSYGSAYSSSVSLEENVACTWNMTLGASNSFKINNWGGSKGTVTVDLNTMKVSVTTDKTEIKELYIIGNFNNWGTPNNASGYMTLTKESKNIYSGIIDKGTPGVFEFKVFDKKTSDYSRSYGASEDVKVILDDNVPYSWEMTGGNSAKAFHIENWGDGEGTMTVDLAKKTLTITTPHAGPYYPAHLSLIGTFNDWNTEDTTYTLTKLNDEGEYTGSFNIPAVNGQETDTIQFKLLEDYSWDRNYGASDDDYSFEMFKDSQITRNINRSGYNWRLTNWAGGNLIVNVSIKDQSMTLETPDQPKEGGDDPELPVDPEVIYLIGDMQGWDIESDEMQLLHIEETLYSGKFEVEAAEKISFRFYTELGDWDSNSIGASLEEEDSIDVLFDENNYFEKEYIIDGKGNWTISDWNGGILNITLDIENNILCINAEIREEPVIPRYIYLIGSMQGWDINSDKLQLEETEDNVFTGYFNLAADEDIYFRFYTELGDLDNNSLGAVLTGNEKEGEDSAILWFDQRDYFTGPYVVNGNVNWHMHNWGGGTVSMTVNMVDETITVHAPGSGVEEIELGTNFTFSGGIITVNKTEYIRVSDLTGKCVASALGETLDISNLPKGIYMISTSNMKPIKIAK